MSVSPDPRRDETEVLRSTVSPRERVERGERHWSGDREVLEQELPDGTLLQTDLVRDPERPGVFHLTSNEALMAQRSPWPYAIVGFLAGALLGTLGTWAVMTQNSDPDEGPRPTTSATVTATKTQPVAVPGKDAAIVEAAPVKTTTATVTAPPATVTAPAPAPVTTTVTPPAETVTVTEGPTP